jgi:DnaJ-class molecular chaperone
MNHLTTMKLSQCFVTLNATPGMAWEDVKKSYHRLAKRYHPDLNPRSIGCENKFKELNGAFKMLETHYKDPKKNRRQSIFSIFRLRPRAPKKNSGASFQPAAVIDVDTQSIPTGSTGAANQKKAGWGGWSESLQTKFNKIERKIFLLDTQKNIRIAPQTALQGGLIRLNNSKETFQVKIPSGDWKRVLIRVPQKGETSFFGKKRGDLVLNIQVIQPEKFDTSRSRFFYTIHVTRENIKSSRVQTLNSVQGPIKFVLPRNTKDGQVIVLKYQARTNSASSPDHMVKVHLAGSNQALK